MKVLVPISGRTSFFPQDDYFFPKPLVEVVGMPMIELVVQQLKKALSDTTFTFVIDRDDARTFSLDRTLQLAAGPTAKIIERPGPTSGALCSCLLAVDDIDPEAPLLISNSDHVLTADLRAKIDYFLNAGADAGVITFDSVHPRWSYVLNSGENRVAQAFEKKVVSRNAIAGIYWFRRAGLFIQAAQRAILNDANTNGMFFISAALNEAILSGADVMFQPIDKQDYHSFYAPSLIAAFENSPAGLALRKRPRPPVNVIIPAAGDGSRFAKAGWKRPKPFIDVDGKPMLSHVIRNVVPEGSKATLLLRKNHMEDQPDIVANFEKSGVGIIPVKELTEGTASTVLLARRVFNNDAPMMVANSDQLVDFDVADYVRDCLDRALDGSILVFRDQKRDPKWSFAKVNEEGLVVEVAEKKPISDLATVGIYLFTRGKDFIASAIDMIVRNDRVNNEFYTCPVYNYMIANGARIGVYEVQAEAMHGLGTPPDLTGYLVAKGLPASQDAPT